MAWLADLAGKAENLLNTIDEQTGASLRNTNLRSKIYEQYKSELLPLQKKKTPPSRYGLRKSLEPRSKSPAPPLCNKEYQRPSRVVEKQVPKDTLRQRKSPNRRCKSPYNLNNCPKTLVEEYKQDGKQSLRKQEYIPGDAIVVEDESLTFQMQNLEVENAMLRNELNVMSNELTELLGRLKKTEDELNETADAVARTEDLEAELKVLRESHNELSEQLKSMQDKKSNNDSVNLKLEVELRQAQAANEAMQAELDKSMAECKRLESDWKAYRARVKSTLQSKDKEIKSLQEGMNLTEDTKILIEQLESLKEEREDLTEAISRFRGDNEAMRVCMEKLEARANQAERTAGALKEALREERGNIRMYEEELKAANVELKTVKMENAQMIKSLEASIRDKEEEINILVEAPRSSMTSAVTLNVGEYGRDDDRKRIEYLTELLVEKQEAIEQLKSDYNTLKIHMGLMEQELKLVYMKLGESDRSRIISTEKTPVRMLKTKNNNGDFDKQCNTYHFDNASENDDVDGSPRKSRRSFYMKMSIINAFMTFYLVALHLFLGVVIIATSSSALQGPRSPSSHT